MIYPSAADILRVVPHANRTIIGSLADAMPLLCEKGGINTIFRLSHLLGQCAHESDGFRTEEEYASGSAYEMRRDLGNVVKGDGRLFKGRADIQLTGRSNYKAASLFVRVLLGRPSIDLVATPQLVATDRAVGLACDIWFWATHKLNALADQGVTAMVITHITKIINGGTNGLNQRMTLTLAFYRMLLTLQTIPLPIPLSQPVTAPAVLISNPIAPVHVASVPVQPESKPWFFQKFLSLILRLLSPR